MTNDDVKELFDRRFGRQWAQDVGDVLGMARSTVWRAARGSSAATGSMRLLAEIVAGQPIETWPPIMAALAARAHRVAGRRAVL